MKLAEATARLLYIKSEDNVARAKDGFLYRRFCTRALNTVSILLLLIATAFIHLHDTYNLNGHLQDFTGDFEEVPQSFPFLPPSFL